jgi:exonuclease SbcC
MIIKRLRIENIRSHGKTDIQFNKGISVFMGRTGSGKSSILMAIEYALFGSESGIQNSAIMRRRSPSALVVLEFEQKGKNYKVIRGLKRSGSNIQVDVNNLKIFEDGKPVEILARSTDLNEKIIHILNYPKDVKPRDLFEVMSYTRQDEIRKIIEMKPQERQVYIDRILQLSKYQRTWDNLFEVIKNFQLDAEKKAVRIEEYDNLIKKITEKEVKKDKLIKEIDEKKMLYEKEKKNYQIHLNELMKLKEKAEKIIQNKKEYDALNGELSRIKNDIQKNEKAISLFKDKSEKLKAEKEKIKVEEGMDELQRIKGELTSKKEFLKEEMSKTKEEVSRLTELEEGICPLCKQKVTKEHKKNLENEYKRKVDEFNEKISEIEKEINVVLEKISLAEKSEKIKEEIDRINFLMNEKENLLKELMDEENEITRKIKHLEKEIGNYDEIKRLIDEKSKIERESNLLVVGIENEIKFMGREIENIKNEIEELKGEIVEIEKNRKEYEKLRNLIDLLSKLREDIRNIREIVRNKFLEDFKREFQQKFEEIRRYEGEYVVDLKSDYEPIAYTQQREEVPITNLSGGEKTSVALAYRLALSNLAAQISGVMQSEILILDEPTIGFDREDIRALPDSLRNIKTIPQIIIVTHEEELKNAADYRYEVKKEDGVSRITEVA